MRFATGPPRRHKNPTFNGTISFTKDKYTPRSTDSWYYNILSPKTSEFAALIKNGDWAPPAPREFMAFHNPGAMKPTPPITKALKSVVRYHVLFSVDDGELSTDTVAVASCFPMVKAVLS